MAGLQDLFIQNLNANRFDNGLPPISPLEKLSICKGAVFTYSLKNWYNENWKQWDDDDEANESTFASLKTKSTQMDDWNDGFIRSLNSADSVLLPPLPFGPYNDPLRTMTLSAVFPLADDGTGNYTDDAIHSNMDALTANFWELSREFAPSTQQRSFLSTLLDQAITSWIKDPSNRDYLAPYDSNNNNSLNGESVGRDNSTGLVRNLLHAMSQNRTGSITQQGNQITVIKSDQVETIINALFRTNMDDGNKNKKSDSNTDHIKLRNANSDITLYTSGALGLRLKYGASVPKQSFLWNMVTFELHALQEMNKGGYSTSTSSSSSSSSSSFMGFLRILWIEVVRQIRWHWENLIPIPHVDPFLYRPSLSTDSDDTLKKDSQHNGTLGIDLNYNILHQKLAMINCCIHQSIKTLPMEEDSSSVPTSGKKISTLFDKVHDSRMTSNNNSKNEKKLGTMDRFNNFLEQLVDGDNDVSTETKVWFFKIDAESDPCQHVPSHLGDIEDWSTGLNRESEIQDPNAFEGRSYQHESIKLLKTDTPLWVPITQNPGFMTEDMIQQQADVFESLGTSDDATQLRAKLQSAQLLSDMQAFKAANPYAVLEDFVRWHSPKDWIESPGCLSARMSEPTNIWQELWKCSRRIPVSRQKSLFNLTAEGEKALHYLESLSVHDVFSLLLPTMGLIMYDTLASQPIVKYIRPVALGLNELATALMNYPWDALK
ncbi:Rab3 GTPase-activating protein catalytic subunit-domain-containing protein [Halteromyces radiatus]|uniref:Rab3 GTPase-activating protein catalytic subunit-domain-containing protein n=1 Tax=Halteromyces radiatus TaxID=101107 RepID=UPI00221E64A4|nr:Rab3 GTPase-activating protein catalytic subunit-domain-containing protein [Halteromyces radiatus]KAI8096731.1 Rab3 GTPase-activating protein catalytic subunit-domain-containing protein [Halteromyces radiatus]